MATIKAYTDLEQSKKLAEILPLESADMCYSNDGTAIKIDANPYIVRYSMWKDYVVEIIPCWSLASLLNIINTIKGWYPGIESQVNENMWQICMFSYETGCDTDLSSVEEELVDACYEVIVKLHELKML